MNTTMKVCRRSAPVVGGRISPPPETSAPTRLMTMFIPPPIAVSETR